MEILVIWEMYIIFCLIAAGLVDFNFSSPNCVLSCILLWKILLNAYYTSAVLSEVFSTGTEWDFVCLLHAFQLMGGI